MSAEILTFGQEEPTNEELNIAIEVISLQAELGSYNRLVLLPPETATKIILNGIIYLATTIHTIRPTSVELRQAIASHIVDKLQQNLLERIRPLLNKAFNLPTPDVS